uniref:hypothetical protein n=1 Tax=Enterocloster clostridioformis TaxID=1531 RepID=UPI0025A5D390
LAKQAEGKCVSQGFPSHTCLAAQYIRPLKFLDTSVVAEAFLHHEERLVDKGGCISFQGRKYETKPSLIGLQRLPQSRSK